MERLYSIRIAPKNEGIEFREGHVFFRFDLFSSWRKWTLAVPGSHWEGDKRQKMTKVELDYVVPKVVDYLKSRNLLRFIGIGSTVKIQEVEYDARFDDPANRHPPQEFRINEKESSSVEKA